MHSDIRVNVFVLADIGNAIAIVARSRGKRWVMNYVKKSAISMAKNNEDFFGELSYMMIRNRLLDLFLFPIGKARKITILAATVKRPYDHDTITKKVLDRLSKIKN